MHATWQVGSPARAARSDRPREAVTSGSMLGLVKLPPATLIDGPPPLEGLRVVDLSRYLPGPFASLQLGRWGAEVASIQRPPGGDPMRFVPPIAPNGRSYASATLEQDKRVLLLDIGDPDELQVARKLCLDADVIIEGFRPGVLARYGLDAASLRAVRPQAIICSISGFGQESNARDRAGHDLTYQAATGLLDRGDGRPHLPTTQTADIAGGLHAVAAICAALVRRERTGEGATIDVSLAGSGASLRTHNFAADQSGHTHGPLDGQLACYDIYETADGRHVAVAALEPHLWAILVEALGSPPALLEVGSHLDPAAQETIRQALRESFVAHPAAYWRTLESTDACICVVRRRDEPIGFE